MEAEEGFSWRRGWGKVVAAGGAAPEGSGGVGAWVGEGLTHVHLRADSWASCSR